MGQLAKPVLARKWKMERENVSSFQTCIHRTSYVYRPLPV